MQKKRHFFANKILNIDEFHTKITDQQLTMKKNETAVYIKTLQFLEAFLRCLAHLISTKLPNSKKP